ncbi:Leucine-rich repeat serine/threonine-protein kinase 1, partial [Geodia barretti]
IFSGYSYDKLPCGDGFLFIRRVRLDDLVPDLLFGDVAPELLLRNHGDSTLASPAHSGTETGTLGNGLGTKGWIGGGVGQGKSVTLKSLPEQNGTGTGVRKMSRKRSHTITGVCTWNGIEPCNQIGIQSSSSSSSGLHIRSYYTIEDEEECVKRESGTSRMLSLKRCLQRAHNDLNKLRQLQCPYIVTAVGIHFSPPSVAVESSPLGSLHHYLREEGLGLVEIGTSTIHHILLQLLSALDYFHREGLNYHTLQSKNVLLWSRDPVSIKLSDSGITHSPRGCQLCSYIKSIPLKEERKMVATRVDYMLLGLLIYEVATGTKPYEEIYTLSTVVLSLLNKRLQLNVEAELANSRRARRDSRTQTPVSCHRLCMQTSIEECVAGKEIYPGHLRARLSLCAGNQEWSPVRLTLNPECLLCSEEADLVYWTSASRGLVTGTLDIRTGTLNSNILQEAPPPQSGLFAKRMPKPVPIAVGRATGLTLVEETQQLWVGAENGSRGSVYVFKLPDMRTHHYIHLQDAVLSLAALNKLAVSYGGEQTKYRVLVGMANGALIQFLGVHQGKILENPLQGPKLVVYLVGNRPCIAMQLTVQGHVWCSSGSDVEVLDTVTLRSIRRIPLTPPPSPEKNRGISPLPPSWGDVITLLRVNWYGVWTVARRSPILRLWNQESGALISQFNIKNINGVLVNDDDITAMSLQGRAVWLGTRNGYLILLDAAAVEEKRETCHLGLQHCGDGKIKNIIPIVSSKKISANLEVFCSLEFPDEVSGSLMMWSYQFQQDWRPKPTNSRSLSAPLPSLSSSL